MMSTSAESESGNTRKFAVLIYFVCLFINSLHSVISENDVGHHLIIGGIFSSQSNAPYLAAEMAINDLRNHYDHDYDNEEPHFFQQVFLEVDCGDEETLTTAMMSNSDVRIWLAGCQQDCLTLAEVAHLQNRTDIIILCYGITSLPFEEGQKHNNLFSLESNAYSIAYTYAHFILHCNWDNIAVIYQQESYSDKYTKIAEYLMGTLQVDSDKQIHESAIEDDTLLVVEYLERVKPSVIVSICDAATARRILCNSHIRKHLGGKHIWMFPGSYEHEWYKPLDYEELDCSVETMWELVDGHLIAKSLNWNHDPNRITYSGKTTADFERQLKQELGRVGGHYIRTDNDEAALVYDAIWASDLVSIQETITRGESRVANEYLPNQELNSIMQNVSFFGISGDFSFNSNRGRSISNSVVQMEVHIGNKYEPFGQHIYGSNQWKFNEQLQGDACSLPSYLATPTTEAASPSTSSVPPPSSTVYANSIDYGLILICSGAVLLNVI